MTNRLNCFYRRKQFATLALASLALVCGCARAEMSAGDLAKQAAILRVTNFMLTGDTTDLRLAFSDSVLVLLPIDGMAATRDEWITNYGQCKTVRSAEFDSAQYAHLDIEFAHATLAATLGFDSSFDISYVSVAIAPGEPARADGTSPDASPENRLIDLGPERAYAAHFSSDSQHVRLVALLSPT